MSGIQKQEEIITLDLHKDEKDRDFVNALVKNKRYAWRYLFTSAIPDWDEPPTFETVIDPESDFVCAVLWIYSMETFVYSSMNAASRDHDLSYVNTLGPMAQALFLIVRWTEIKRKKDSESLPWDKYTNLYRGLSLPDTVVQ